MKTAPMAHQVRGELLLDANPLFYYLGCEQGTGKTWMLLNDAERQFARGLIKGLFILAPKGVHTNWVRREIPTHLSIPHRAEYYLSGMSAARRLAIQKVFAAPPEELAILAMNIDAINTPKGYAMASDFLKRFPSMFVLDEATYAKSPKAGRTRKAIALGQLARSRRAASGTPITNSPLDAWAQFQFLAPGQPLIGPNSYYSFAAFYAQMLPQHHPLVQAIVRQGGRFAQIIEKDKNGRPIFRNLDTLTRKVSPYMFRVVKSECLDLPPKVYQVHPFELEPEQRRIYKHVEREMNLTVDEALHDFNGISVLQKLRQITSGFVNIDSTPVLLDDNPRLDALMDVIETVDGQFIVWAQYREEITRIVERLKGAKVECVQYHGGIGTADREAAVDRFQAGKVRAFVGNPHAAGVGLTLTAANTAIYYSNDFSIETRLQSEDRCHRIGTTSKVLYIDIVAQDTVDEEIAAALRSKEHVAATILEPIAAAR